MKFTAAIALTLPVLALASPLHVVRDASQNSTAVIETYRAAADQAVSDLTIFGCNIASYVEALGPLVAACAIAAISEGKDSAKDATCVADAYQDLKSKKPTECNHCYK